MTKRGEEDSPDWAHFQGYASPSYTSVPDQLFDEHLPYLSGAELKVLLYVIRRTFGFKKDSDNISLSQMLGGIVTRDGRTLDHGVGLTKKTLLQAIRTLEEKNLLLTERRQSLEKGNEPTTYCLRLASNPIEKTTPPLGEKLHQGGEVRIPPRARGKNSPTQETDIQETVSQDIYLRNSNSTAWSKKEESRSEEERHSNHQAPTSNAPSTEAHLNELPRTRTREPRTAGFAPIGDTLARTRSNLVVESEQTPEPPLTLPPAHLRRRTRIVPTPYIESCVTDFTSEFHDSEHLRSNLTQAMHLFQESGLSEDAFCSMLYQSRSITKQQGNITKSATSGPYAGTKNKMPYMFAVLRDLLGLKDEVPEAGKVPD